MGSSSARRLKWDRRVRRPIPASGLDKALGLAIGLGRIGPGADVLETKALAGVSEGKGFVTGAVVGHDTLDRYPEARVVGDGRLEEGDGTFPFLVLHDLTEGDPGSVIDADMHVLPARPLAIMRQEVSIGLTLEL